MLSITFATAKVQQIFDICKLFFAFCQKTPKMIKKGEALPHPNRALVEL